MKTEERILNIKLEKKDGKLYYGGYLDLRGTQITDTSNINTNAPTHYEWRNRKYIKADDIFSVVISHRGNVYRVRQIGKEEITYLVTDGAKWAHGKTLKDAKNDLIYKSSNRDKSKYEDYTLETELSFSEAIEMYRVITGACSFGTKGFVEGRLKERKKKYTISEVIELTKGEYGNGELVSFFE